MRQGEISIRHDASAEREDRPAVQEIFWTEEFRQRSASRKKRARCLREKKRFRSRDATVPTLQRG